MNSKKKTEFMLLGSEYLRDSGAFPCSVCRKGVGVNSVFGSTRSHGSTKDWKTEGSSLYMSSLS